MCRHSCSTTTQRTRFGIGSRGTHGRITFTIYCRDFRSQRASYARLLLGRWTRRNRAPSAEWDMLYGLSNRPLPQRFVGSLHAVLHVSVWIVQDWRLRRLDRHDVRPPQHVQRRWTVPPSRGHEYHQHGLRLLSHVRWRDSADACMHCHREHDLCVPRRVWHQRVPSVARVTDC